MSSSPASPSDFVSYELQTSLEEQRFGIKTFTILPPTCRMQSEANVTLLDDRCVKILLTNRGYEVEGLNERPLETLESLLAAISVQYQAKRMALLWIKLNDIATVCS